MKILKTIYLLLIVGGCATPLPPVAHISTKTATIYLRYESSHIELRDAVLAHKLDIVHEGPGFIRFRLGKDCQYKTIEEAAGQMKGPSYIDTCIIDGAPQPIVCP